jgi:hypothetical protein
MAIFERRADECGVLLLVRREIEVGAGYIGDGIFPRYFSDSEKKL